MKKWLRLILEILLFGSLVGSAVFIYLQTNEIEMLKNDLVSMDSKKNNPALSNQSSQQANLIAELTELSSFGLSFGFSSKRLVFLRCSLDFLPQNWCLLSFI